MDNKENEIEKTVENVDEKTVISKTGVSPKAVALAKQFGEKFGIFDHENE